jgi:cell shape-determining protein MreC
MGGYRITYTVADDVLLIVVVALGHRREVYDRQPVVANRGVVGVVGRSSPPSSDANDRTADCGRPVRGV